MEQKDLQANLHAGHRQRMRDRLMREGAESFQSHELLEMLLYHSIPRQNTNETAHLLLKRFGSLRGVMDADYEDLIRISGVKDSSATLLKLCSGVFRRMAQEDFQHPARYDSFKQLAQYLKTLYVGVTQEKVYLLMFDNGMRMLGCVCLSEGTVNHANIIPRTIIRHALMCDASCVVLAHNHPGGVAIPSGDDIECTHRLHSILDSAGITLIDHVIVAGNSVMPILIHRLGTERPSPFVLESGLTYQSFFDGCLEQ